MSSHLHELTSAQERVNEALGSKHELHEEMKLKHRSADATLRREERRRHSLQQHCGELQRVLVSLRRSPTSLRLHLVSEYLRRVRTYRSQVDNPPPEQGASSTLEGSALSRISAAISAGLSHSTLRAVHGMGEGEDAPIAATVASAPVTAAVAAPEGAHVKRNNCSSSNNNSNNNTTTSLTSVSASSSSSSRVRKHPAWIAKASSSNRGENLFFSHDVDTLIEALRESSLRSENPVQEWVVQRYVAPPLLIGNRKFHIRAHFLVVGCPYTGMTRAWLHRRHHVLLASSVPYNGESQDRHVHLTNHCIQAKHPNYNEESQIFHFDSLRKLFHFKEGQGRGGGKALNLEKYLLERMSTALSEALAAAAAAPVAFAPLPQAFELFGADFTLEDRGSEPPSVWLLEVNAGPDLEVFGQRYRSECVDLLRSCMKLAVEPYLLEAAPALFRAPPTGAEAASAASRAGFYGEHCLWHAPAQQHSAKEVLDSFKKRIGIAGRWARALHDQSGVTVRGPQSAVVL